MLRCALISRAVVTDTIREAKTVHLLDVEPETAGQPPTMKQSEWLMAVVHYCYDIVAPLS